MVRRLERQPHEKAGGEMSASKAEIAMAMKRKGGSFVQALGEALLHADWHNALLIEKTWPIYWQEYSYWAERMKKLAD